ncbi:MAG: hypothetical protein ACMXYF_03765 [Candidatus Woesearchaeota archaeon]
MSEQPKQETNDQNMSKDEQIGYHKGSVAVLTKEREELLRIVQITEQLIQMHVKSLSELGVNVESQKSEEKPAPKKRVPIENLI